MAGCRAPLPRELDLPKDAVAVAPGDTVSPGLVIDVYVDGSGSIEHFLHNPEKQAPGDELSPASGKNYMELLLENIEPTARSSPWGTHPIHIWQFGEDCPHLIPEGKASVMGTSPAGSFPEKDTKIDVPYRLDPTAGCSGRPQPKRSADDADETPSGPPELKILVSDLYVSDPNRQILAALGQQIGQRYLRDASTAVCVLAIRNPFYGHVEDLPGHAAVKTQATSMPFYVILTGPVDDVKFGVRLLLDKVGLLDAFQQGRAQLIYFAKGEAPYDAAAPTVDGEPHQVHLFESHYRDSSIPFYRLDKGTMTVRWPATTPDAWASRSAAWDPRWSIPVGTKGDYQIAASLYGPRGAYNPPKDNDPGGQHAARASSNCDGTCIDIDDSGLQRGRDYLFRVNVGELPSQSFEANSAAMQNWSIEMQDAEAVSRDPGGRFPRIHGIQDSSPGRTPDLSHFLVNLQGEVYAGSTQKIANHHYIFVHAN